MKIEKLRNNHKKEIIIGIMLIVVIGGALTFRLTHSKYRVTQSIDLGSGVINYTVPDFKIMAMYKNDGSGDVSIDSMPSGLYAINEEKTYCTSDGTNQVKGKIKTISGNHVISGLNKGDKCYLYFDKAITIDNIIAGLNAKSTTPDFSVVASTDEGVFKTTDEMYEGTTYYWRGAATTNYLKFAGFCWRIVRINGDKTIRLIYDGSTCHANGTSTTENLALTLQNYNSKSNASYYVGWTQNGTQRTLNGTSSNAKNQIESWYKINLENYGSKIADGKYCNDRDVVVGGETSTWGENGSEFWYAGYKRLYQDYSPTFNCPSGDIYTLNVGLITADEVMYAGGGWNSDNSSYYLYNGQSYWTMTPAYWNGSYAYKFYVYMYGHLNNVSSANLGLRPIINLKSDITFSSGDGTILKPYIVS